jgi:hypothetical protein
MPRIAFDYRFRVRLPVDAATAYRWATDYAPDDPARMGQSGRRRIERPAPRTVILTDSVLKGGRRVTKQRLVRLRPRLRSWTNTHLAGPTQHSQFLYRVVPRGAHASTLEFVGLQVEPSPRPLSPAELARRARTVAREDAATWVLLVRAMRRDLGLAPPRPPRRRSR